MTLDDLDRRLTACLQAVDAMSTNLVELDEDPNRKLLAGATLTGVTAARWAPAAEALAQTWGWFSQFKDLVVHAQQIRGTKTRLPPDQLAELTRILTGPCVELATTQVPAAERRLLGASQTTVLCTLNDLLARMSSAYDQVNAITTATARAWNELLPPLQAATAELTRLRDLARSLGEAHVPELNRVRAELDRLADGLATDPLSVDVGGAGVLQSSLAATAADLDRLALLRQHGATQVDGARATLAQLTHAVAEADRAYAETAEKISRPAVARPPALDAALTDGPDQLNDLARSGDWRAFGDTLDRWTRSANGLLAELDRSVEACRAPLDARNELRGRLNAYRAKASAFGLLEDPASAALYAEAHDVLYTAPTDLAAAVTLVNRYRQAIPLTPPSREATP